MKTKDIVDRQMLILGMWNESIGFKKFWRSYFYMVIHPVRSLRLTNFAIHVLSANYIIPDTGDYLEIDQSCDTCELYEVCDLHTEELGISPCQEHVMRVEKI